MPISNEMVKAEAYCEKLMKNSAGTKVLYKGELYVKVNTTCTEVFDYFDTETGDLIPANFLVDYPEE